MKVPSIITDAWEHFKDNRSIISAVELSPFVSQNHVYQLTLNDRSNLIAKSSRYGNYQYFVQDHQAIRQWINLLQGSRYANFLAGTWQKDSEVFTYQAENEWVVFYEELPLVKRLPAVLSNDDIRNFAIEMAQFHRASLQVASHMTIKVKSAWNDVHSLFLRLRSNEIAIDYKQKQYLMNQCNLFARNQKKLGYDNMIKVPILVDWNIGNFSIQEQNDESFEVVSRWDYDWFRIEPLVFDFYFFSRVVRQEGDRVDFSYLPEPLLEPRFHYFLSEYVKILPLKKADFLMLKEAYRFFILNYVIKDGYDFFQPAIFMRLKQEALQYYLPVLDTMNFSYVFKEFYFD